MKSGNLNFLEPSGPLQACNGTALPLPLFERPMVFAWELPNAALTAQTTSHPPRKEGVSLYDGEFQTHLDVMLDLRERGLYRLHI